MSEYGAAERGLVWGYAEPHGGASDGDQPLMETQLPDGFDLAFEGLYRLAYRVAFRILGDRGDAEDVAQEALARASVRWSRLQDRPEGWVTRVASNLAIDRYRRRRRPTPQMTGPLGIVDPYLGERGDLVAALRRLPRRQREAVARWEP
jgi:RNA polymerase sigma-70 factor (ECF subfamily)